ncbi:MAG: hypothetical protein Q4F54_02170 [Coriobacteriia bacterium]|nr:hypothetical protein [Coriobacteriia bacterium]
MFKDCNKLEGSDGQIYDGNHVTCEYARPDHLYAKEAKPGYFSTYSNFDIGKLRE